MTRLNTPALALAALLLTAACGGAKKDEKAAAAASEGTPVAATAAPAAQKAVPVTVQTLAPETFTSYLEVQGRVDFDQNATVAARAAGTLTSLNVQRGDHVSKNQVLATVDAAILDAAITELKTRLDLTRVIFEKQERLWKQQIGTEIQYLQAKNNYDALRNSLTTQQRQRELYTVRAPFSGTVDEVLPKLGEVTAPGAPIARLVGGQGGKVLAEVSEAYASKLKAGDAALVKIPDLADEELPATVRVVGRAINAGSRTFTVELRLKDGARAQSLRPNMVAVARIQAYRKTGALTLPLDVVQKDEKDTFVFLADGGKARKQIIKIGATYGGRVEVTGGLQVGEQVIVGGYQALNEGQSVAPANTPS
ncbi:MAG: efflux RND transporter periplasmic adaptor subunit [Hymenobacteraceae bacterium]|nr:efflux RND transporter periplasmic adaptor subunit [Hymenobacteraceae bacterium]